MWHKAASTPRPRIPTLGAGILTSGASLRHTSSAANFSELITSIPVFDIDTVILYLGKLDETKYKKEKLSLDSIRGGITGEYAKEKELMRQLFCDQLAYILEVLDNQKNKASAATWSYLFFQRSQRCQDIIPSNKIAHYHHLMKNYLRILKKKEMREEAHTVTTARIRLGESFMDFLQTHSTDPDSCLVGLPCSDESLKSVVRHVDPAATDTSNSMTITHHQLCSMIVEWGVGDDETWMKEQIQKLCTSFRGVDRMERGDLAIVALTTEDTKSMIFGRFTGMKKQNNTHLEFYVNSEESKTEWVSCKQSTI